MRFVVYFNDTDCNKRITDFCSFYNTAIAVMLCLALILVIVRFDNIKYGGSWIFFLFLILRLEVVYKGFFFVFWIRRFEVEFLSFFFLIFLI